MNTPVPANPGSNASRDDDEIRAIAWLQLRREMETLSVKLQYLKLMMKLGVIKR